MRLGQFSIRDAVWFMLVAALLTFGLINWMRSRPVTDAVTEGKIAWTNSQTQMSIVSFPQGTVENGRILIVYNTEETSMPKGIVQVTKVHANHQLVRAERCRCISSRANRNCHDDDCFGPGRCVLKSTEGPTFLICIGKGRGLDASSAEGA